MANGREGESGEKATPEFSPKFNDSTAHVYDFDGILNDAARGEVTIFDGADFPSPIYRTTISAKQVELPLREHGTSFLAVIKIDPLANVKSTDAKDYLSKELSGRLGDKLSLGSYPRADITRTVFSNCFYVMDNEGNRFVLWIAQDNIVVSNNLTLTAGEGETKKTLTVAPKPDHIAKPQQSFRTFLQGFMYAADLAYTNREGYLNSHLNMDRLKREYHIGRHRSVPNLPPSSTYTTPAPSTERPKPSPTETTKENQLTKEQAPDLSELGIEVIESNFTFADIGGYEGTKSKLQNAALSFKHPDIMEKWVAPRVRGILLYGPPGTGKTMLSLALAKEIQAQVWRIGPDTTARKWHGESEANMKRVFALARKTQKPLILLFDEVEAVITNPQEVGSGGAQEARRGVASIFKTELNTLFDDNPNVLLVGITNYPERIDESLIRSGRFDYKIFVPMPDLSARAHIITLIRRQAEEIEKKTGRKIYGPDVESLALAGAAEGLSGADIDTVFGRIRLSKAMQEARESTLGINTKIESISQQELWDALHHYKQEKNS